MSDSRASDPQPVRETTDAQRRGFVDVRAPSGRLICRIDGARQLLEWRDGKHVELVDLRPFLDAQQHNK